MSPYKSTLSFKSMFLLLVVSHKKRKKEKWKIGNASGLNVSADTHSRMADMAILGISPQHDITQIQGWKETVWRNCLSVYSSLWYKPQKNLNFIIDYPTEVQVKMQTS